MVVCVGAVQYLKCRRFGIGDRVAVDVSRLAVFAEPVAVGGGDDGKVFGVVRKTDPSLR